MINIGYILNRKPAMTLAEVLITLGIIGVVAAFTIPTLMSNIQDKQFKEAAKEAYSKASQAIQQMKLDNGSWDDTMDCYTFFNSFESYFRKLDNVQASLVGAQNTAYGYYYPGATTSTVYTQIDKNSTAASTWWSGYQFMSADGMNWSTPYWAPTENNPLNKFGITVDVNSYKKNPNVCGRDVFSFQIINGSLLPMGANTTVFPASSYCIRNGSSNYYQGLGCMYNVMQGINY